MRHLVIIVAARRNSYGWGRVHGVVCLLRWNIYHIIVFLNSSQQIADKFLSCSEGSLTDMVEDKEKLIISIKL